MDENMMRAVCDTTERIVTEVKPTHYGLSTPCSEWTVRDVANHLLATLELGRALLSDEMPAVQAGPGEVPVEDLVGTDLVGAYRIGATALVTATTSESVGRLHGTPFGEMPGAGLAGFAALDVLVHGWDLAKAIGHDTTIDPALADPMLAFAQQAIGDDMGMRAPRIGPAIEVPDGADSTSRLVAYLGREP